LRRFSVAVLFAVSVWSGCGPAKKGTTASGTVLEQIGEDDAAVLKAEVPEAYDKAARYALLADEMAKKGDADAEERYAVLARYQLRVARMLAEKKRLKARIEKTDEAQQRVEEAIANTLAALEIAAAEAERQEIRRHLVAVVTETRRKAAAEEAIRERFMSGKNKTAIRRARKLVAEQMISRANVWLDVLLFFVPEGVETDAYLMPVREAIDAAKIRDNSVDLAMVQEDLERAGAAGRRLVQEAWQGAESDRESIEQRVADLLDGAGFSVSNQAFGIVVPLTEEASRSAAELNRLYENIKAFPALRVVVLARVHKNKAAEERSNVLAEKIATRLTDAGLPKEAVQYRGCGTRVPLAALKAGEERVALLLVPIPIGK
jgi:hypothetical protein